MKIILIYLPIYFLCAIPLTASIEEEIGEALTLGVSKHFTSKGIVVEYEFGGKEGPRKAQLEVLLRKNDELSGRCSIVYDKTANSCEMKIDDIDSDKELDFFYFLLKSIKKNLEPRSLTMQIVTATNTEKN